MRAPVVLKLACLAAFLLAVALVQVVKSIDVERYRGVLASLSQQATGRTLSIRGQLSLRLSLSPGIEANDIVIPAALGAAEPDLLTIDHLDADIALLPLLAGEVRIQKLHGLGVHILLQQGMDGHSDWSLLRFAHVAAPSLATPVTKLEVRQLELEDVSLRVVDSRNAIDQRLHFDLLSGEAERPTGKIAVTAKGRWNDWPFDASGIVGSLPDLLDPSKPYPIAMKAVLPGLVTTANGTIEHGDGGDHAVTLAVTAGAIDIGAAGRLFKIALPSLGAARASFTLSGSLSTPRLDGLDLVFGRHDMLAVSVKGSVADPIALKGVDVAVVADGENLPAFGRIFDIDLPSLGPIHLSTHLTDTPDGWRFADINGGSPKNDVAGHLFIAHRDGRLVFDAALESTKIDMAIFRGSPPNNGKDEVPDSRVFSDRPLPVAVLRAVDGTFLWKIKHVVADGLEADDVEMPATLHDGRLEASIAIGRMAGGNANASFVLDAAQSPSDVTATLATDQVEAGPILASLGIATGLQGARTDLHMTVSANGDSAHAISSDLAGGGTISIGSGTFDGAKSADGVPWLREGRIGLGCVYSHFTIEDGLAVTESIVLDLTPVTIGGRGSVNLGREELDLVFVPRPKGPNESGVLVPLDVGGTLRHPSIVPSRGTAVKGVAPILPPMSAASAGAGACQAAVLSVKPVLPRHLLHPSTASVGPGTAN